MFSLSIYGTKWTIKTANKRAVVLQHMPLNERELRSRFSHKSSFLSLGTRTCQQLLLR